MTYKLLQLRDKILQDKFLFSSAIVFISSFIVNVLNYVFTLLTARLVAIENYGEFTTLLSLLILFSVPSAAMTMYISREVSAKNQNHQDKKSFLDKIFTEIILLSALLWVLFLAFVPFLSRFLKIEFPLLFLFSLLLPLSMVASFQVGYLQGEHKFFNSSKLSISSGLSKLLISLLLLYAGFSVYGILFALILSGLLNLFIERKMYLDRSFKKSDAKLLDSLSHIISLTFFSSLFLAVLGNLDVLLAKHFLNSYDAGAYGALSTMGKIIIFATGSFVTVMMPMVSRQHTSSVDSAQKLFKTSFAYMLICGSAIVLFFNLFSDFSVHILFGSKYNLIAGYLGIFSIATLFLALSISFINFFIAIKNKTFIYFLSGGLFLEAILLWYNHSSIAEYVESVLLSTLFILVFMIINYLFYKRSN